MTGSTNIRSLISDHLAVTGMSRAELSKKSGLGEGIVAKILREPAYVPPTKALTALSNSLGITLPSPFESSETWAQVRIRLVAEDPKDRRVSRINWLMRNTGWIAEIKTARRKDIVEFFNAHGPVTFDLAPSSYASYKSDLLSCPPKRRGRKRGIRDVVGPLRNLYDAIAKDEAFKDYHLSSGAFIAWMDERSIMPHEVDSDTLATYYADRCADHSKPERLTRIHVQRVAALTRRLAVHPDYIHHGFAALPSPWSRPKVLPGDREFAPLMTEFDERVTPWLLGNLSASGKPREVFLAELDAAAKKRSSSDIKVAALSRARTRSKNVSDQTSSVDVILTGAGFLRGNKRWQMATVKSYRKTLCAMLRRVFVKEGIAVTSIAELVDPQMMELLLLLNAEANPDTEGFGSSYATTFAERTLKIAAGYVGLSKENLVVLAHLRSDYDPKRTGMARRNQAKIELFTDTRIERFWGLSALLMREIKLDIAARRRQAKERGEVARAGDLYDSKLASRVMQVIAHDLLLARAPRSSNVINARLDWIRWKGNCATLVVPASKVKGRNNSHADLIIPLSEEPSETLRDYIEVIRIKALRAGDECNPFLFPSPKKSGHPYGAVLNALCRRVHEHIGTPLNPHLYRHLIGWIWLRKDPSALPQVQRLLGHKSIVTTMRYYADIADDVAINLWQRFITQETG